jgi:hypothetical protein
MKDERWMIEDSRAGGPEDSRKNRGSGVTMQERLVQARPRKQEAINDGGHESRGHVGPRASGLEESRIGRRYL